jgi:hypothetical protein
MSETLTHAPAAETVTAVVNYSLDTGEKPVSETGGPDGLTRTYRAAFEPVAVAIENGRPRRGQYRLDEAGFQLADHATAMTDFFDRGAIAAVYYPEAAALIARLSGAARVHVFDHTLRSGAEAVRQARKIREPVRTVHNDYTEWSGPQRVRDIFPDEAEALLTRRFAIIQVWRAIGAPPPSRLAEPARESHLEHVIHASGRGPEAITCWKDPLTLADARTLAPQDFIAAERRFPNRVGEIYMLRASAAHRWTYFPRMTRDEALVFKVYDAARDGKARWCAHTSFEDPTSPPDAPERESIELRAFAFW